MSFVSVGKWAPVPNNQLSGSPKPHSLPDSCSLLGPAPLLSAFASHPSLHPKRKEADHPPPSLCPSQGTLTALPSSGSPPPRPGVRLAPDCGLTRRPGQKGGAELGGDEVCRWLCWAGAGFLPHREEKSSDLQGQGPIQSYTRHTCSHLMPACRLWACGHSLPAQPRAPQGTELREALGGRQGCHTGCRPQPLSPVPSEKGEEGAHTRHGLERHGSGH